MIKNKHLLAALVLASLCQSVFGWDDEITWVHQKYGVRLGTTFFGKFADKLRELDTKYSRYVKKRDELFLAYKREQDVLEAKEKKLWQEREKVKTEASTNFYSKKAVSEIFKAYDENLKQMEMSGRTFFKRVSELPGHKKYAEALAKVKKELEKEYAKMPSKPQDMETEEMSVVEAPTLSP